jgi:3-deoxy-D-manno-octulosonate 8-phosphate phosphatase KdsC-like HAD superfamily phosphatase
MKKFDMRDGMGLEILRQHNVEVVVITSENSELVAKRMQKLQIKHAFLGVKDKYSFLQNSTSIFNCLQMSILSMKTTIPIYYEIKYKIPYL